MTKPSLFFKPIYILLLALITIVRCKKEADNNNNQNNGNTYANYTPFTGPLIKTFTASNGVISYTYDTLGRVITATNQFHVDSYFYAPARVTLKIYDNGNPSGVPDIHFFTRNEQGLITTFDSTEFYTYDAERHVITDSTVGDPIITCTYINGNLISTVPAVGHESFTYQYFTDKTSTIASENFGMNWASKSSVNLDSTLVHNILTSHDTLYFSYDFDTQNRVVRKTNTNSLGNGHTDYTYY